MTATAESIKPLCAKCRANPTLGALSICKPCLQRQVEAERKERERRMRRVLKEQRQVRRGVR